MAITDGRLTRDRSAVLEIVRHQRRKQPRCQCRAHPTAAALVSADGAFDGAPVNAAAIAMTKPGSPTTLMASPMFHDDNGR
jgi:hypothetical protein